MLRVYNVQLTGNLVLTSTLKAKGREAGKKKPFVEVSTGDSFFFKAQKWVRRMMRIDHRNNRYTERVIDPRTGETIHSCDEPLTEHQGHGSAKAKHDV